MNKLKSLSLLLILSSPLLCMDIQMQDVSAGAGGAGGGSSDPDRLSGSKRKQSDSIQSVNLDQLPSRILQRLLQDDGDTALMKAAIGGHTDTVKALIDKGADVNAKDKRGDTALMLAARDGRTEIAKALIGKDANINAADKDDNTALTKAARVEHSKTEGASIATLNALLTEGADVNHENNQKEMAISMAVKSKNWEIVQILSLRHMQDEQ